MKIDYISDIHIDFRVREMNPNSPKIKKQVKELIEEIGISNSKSDVLIIAGDLGHYFSQDSEFLLQCKEIYKHIILVRGNHDMYLVSKSQQSKYLFKSENRYLELKRFCSNNDIHYLDGNVICIDGIKIGGLGMSWDKSFLDTITDTSDDEVNELFIRYMNDARLIMDGEPYYIPMAYGSSVYRSTFKHKDYFIKELDKLKNIEPVDIMVTHYYPLSSYLPVTYPKQYKEDVCSTFYMFNGEQELKRINPKYWIFGHMHKEYDFFFDNTNLLCNPLGYPGERTYGKVKTIEILWKN